MPDPQQLSFFQRSRHARACCCAGQRIYQERKAAFRLTELDRAIGVTARWDLESVLNLLILRQGSDEG